MSRLLVGMLAMGAVCMAMPVHAAVIATSNFEDGLVNKGFGFDGAGGGTLVVNYSVDAGAGMDGSQALHISADASAATTWWVQNYNTGWVGYTAPTLGPGEHYQISLDAKGSQVGNIAFNMVDTGGGQNYTTTFAVSTSWQTFTFDCSAAGTYAAFVAAMDGGFLTWGTNIGQAWGFDAGNDYYIDNVKLEVVPEPATLGLLALAGLALLRRRR